MDPISERWPVPFHPSYEDKPDVPDRVFYKVGKSAYSALVSSWRRAFDDVRRKSQPDILHLHHLNHMHLASDAFGDVPRLTQLHGTEIKMLERMTELEADGSGTDLMAFWRKRIQEAASMMDHFFAISPDVQRRGQEQFGLAANRITAVPNGVDVSLFKPLRWSAEKRLDFLHRILVEEPRGWSEGGGPGSVRYGKDDLERLKRPDGSLKPLLLFVGRFLGFKRVPLLLEAVAEVNTALGGQEPPYNLLVWGGMPGEWEGRHPHTVAEDLGLSNVFFCGWLPHDVLSQGLNTADCFVAPSHYEPFGQVFLEAMATGIPVIATRSGGPLSFVVDHGPKANGWLCDVDDRHSLATVIRQAVTNEPELVRRGSNALALIREKYDWRIIAGTYEKIYLRQIAERAGP
jgi:glycosyltransferase involved in cell wall biosynthesis